MNIRGLYSGGENDVVYFEKQGAGRQCGLHAINNLMQGPVVDESVLKRLAQRLDDRESQLARNAFDEYRNASADGFYGVDVMSAALLSLGFEMLPIRHPKLQNLHVDAARHGDGFICNLREHWFCIRVVLGRWFALDSLRTPQPISEANINSLVLSLENRAYIIFVVRSPDWPRVKLPEPAPANFPKVPLITTPSSQLTGCAFLTFDAVGKLDSVGAGVAEMAGESGNHVTPTQQGAGYKWPENGGHRLGETKKQGSACQAAEALGAIDDPELTAVVRASILEYKAQLRSPPEPPSQGGLQLKVMDPYGGCETRRFSSHHTMIDVFDWIFKSDVIWSGNMTVALGVIPRVSLLAQFPKREYCCITAQRQVFDSAGNEVTNASIGGLFPQGESFRIATPDY